MDFELSAELQEAKERARGFATREMTIELAESCDAKEEFPEELRRKVFEQGLVDCANPWVTLLTTEELCRKDAGLGVSAVLSFFGVETIMLFGNDDQKARYLTRAAKGEAVMGLAVTEPEAGSDVAGIKATATRDGEKFVMNGAKMFITNGGIADFLIVLARTSPSGEKRHLGLSLFVVDMNSNGITRNKLHGKLGVRATNTAEIMFDRVEVPARNLIGEEGKGFYYVMAFFNISRIFVAAQAVGIAQGALDRTLEFIEGHPERDGYYAKEQIQMTIGEMATRIEAARLLTYRAASRLFQFKPDPKFTSMAKAYAGETAVFTTEKALELTGIGGISSDLEREYRDAKIMEIWEGTSEVEKLVIARTLRKELKQKGGQ